MGFTNDQIQNVRVDIMTRTNNFCLKIRPYAWMQLWYNKNLQRGDGQFATSKLKAHVVQ